MFGMNKKTLVKQIANLIMQNRLQVKMDLVKNLLYVDESSTDIKEL